MGLSSDGRVFIQGDRVCIYSCVGRAWSRRALLRNHSTIVRGTRFILSIRRKSAFICEATVKAILAEGLYILEARGRKICVRVGGKKKLEERDRGARALLRSPPPFARSQKPLIRQCIRRRGQ